MPRCVTGGAGVLCRGDDHLTAQLIYRITTNTWEDLEDEDGTLGTSVGGEDE